MIVHANPSDVELMVYPAPEGQRALWGRVRQPDDDPDLAAVFDGVKAGVVAFGHFHTTFQRQWRGIRLVDVAPCSLPSIDRDPRARYTLFEWEGSGWKITHRWVEYDYRLESEALRRSGMPYRETFTRYFDI